MSATIISLSPWCWTDDIEAETWQPAGRTREEALAFARSESGLPSWIAPTRPATQADVDNWMGDTEIEVGSPIIIFDSVEDVTPDAGGIQP